MESGRYRLRRHNKLPTPEINTYAKQMKQCERSSARIPFKEVWHGSKVIANTLLSGRYHDFAKPERWPPLLLKRRSPFTAPQLNTSRRESGESRASNRRRSSFSHFTVNKAPDYFNTNGRTSTDLRNSSSGNSLVVPGVGLDQLWGTSAMRHSFSSYRESKALTQLRKKDVPRASRRESVATRHQINVTNQLRQAEILSSLRRDEEYLIHALTTLAINSLTSNSKGPSRRNSTIKKFSQNIDLLLPGEDNEGKDARGFAKHNADAVEEDVCEAEKEIINDDSHSSGSSVQDSESDATTNENEEKEPCKRYHVNKLRQYLKTSGLGDPLVIQTLIVESEEQKKRYLRLMKRIKRGVSPEKQERLRLKARLDYEMNIMRAESFCEQQGQVYMRTASADMDNRDIQLLEEELRLQALQELKASNELHQNKNTRSKQLPRPSRMAKQEGEQETDEVGDGVDGRAEGNVNQSPDAFYDDGMSGLLRSPLTKKEIEQRIQAWLAGVEEALGRSHEGVNKDAHDHDKGERGHNEGIIRDSQNPNKGERSDAFLIKEVRRANAYQKLS